MLSLQRMIPRFWNLLLLSAILLTAFRLAHVVVTTDHGSEMLMEWLWDRTLGELGNQPIAIDEQPPLTQAKFWKEEAWRIGRAYPESAAVVMGAALILDRPGLNHRYRYASSNERSLERGAYSINNSEIFFAE